ITDWEDRRKIKGLQGGAPSSWAATTEFNFGKDQLYDFLGTANLLWSGKSMPDDQLAFTIEPLIGDIHVNLSGKPLPGATARQVQPLIFRRLRMLP
ncbi:MAG TPA: hypothetical protein VFI14_00660, partial [Chryseosolibacter sp.]|nr:hypothetical protein [Chryseosolibacter sp.]